MSEAKIKTWICNFCGRKHGKRIPIAATCHFGICDWCGEHKGVTEPRDFGIHKSKREKDLDNLI